MIRLAVLRRQWRAIAVLASMLAGLACGVSGAAVSIDTSLQQLRWAFRDRPASGTIHIVEIDARSIAAIDHWPWPRRNHALLIDRLRGAGAASIVFDVDFSARSTARDDGAFVAALNRAGGSVILPTFRQRQGDTREGWLDTLPFAEARNHALLAAVSVRPDPDGYVRSMPIATITRDLPRPSLSAMIAHASGQAHQSFPIDYSIDPQTIPRHSFVDILQGRFDPTAVRGKRIIIGASAIELGDHYAVPRYGVIPGVVVQALAAETLMTGTPRVIWWAIPFAAATVWAAALVRLCSRWKLAAASAAGPLILMCLTLGAETAFGWTAKLAPALVLLFCISVTVFAMRMAASFERRRMIDFETGLANKNAMLGWLASNEFEALIVARIEEFERLSAALGATNSGEIIRRVCDRIELVTGGLPVFRIEESLLAWPVDQLNQTATEDRFAALKATMLNPIEVGGRRADVALRLGLAKRAEGVPAQLLAFASLAAEHARHDPAGWHAHRNSECGDLQRDISLLGELDEAVRTGQIVIAYQPKLDLSTNVIRSVEALARWHHPISGQLSPDVFVPLAERHDRILALTLFVLDRALADCAEWRRNGHDVSVAVNISSKLVALPAFIEAVQGLVRHPDFMRDRLIFEVTETSAMSDPQKAIVSLGRFRALGIAISMDDYGTGQSTLSYLQQLPLDELKIDRRFVEKAHLNAADAVLVRSTIDMAHQLGLKVVAEEVEDQACLDFLRSVQCDFAQGFFVSQPVSALATRHLLAEPTKQAA